MRRQAFRIASLLALFLQLTKAASAQDVHPQRIDKNVVYGMYSGLALLMDVYHAEKPNGYGVVWINGSGWNAPLAWDAPALKDRGAAAKLYNSGYTVFVINHRQTPRFQYPAPLEDAQRAVRFIR